jgi:transcriptional regulator with XRE-family HTH domain
VLRRHLKALNYTQERLAGIAEIDLRTVQRAVGGQGISKENLSSIASALGLDERRLVKEAVSAGPPSPDKRIPLKLVRSGRDLVDLVERCFRSKWTLEIGPLDEHRYNRMVGEDLMVLAEDLEKPARSENERIERVRHAQGIISLSHHFGFRLFAGNYTEVFTVKRRQQRRKATLIVAAPLRDPRIIRTRKGPELDVVRDSRRLLVGAALAGHCTTYDWLEDQLIGKSDGEFRVKNEFRRILSEVMEEMNQAEEQARKVTR